MTTCEVSNLVEAPSQRGWDSDATMTRGLLVRKTLAASVQHTSTQQGLYLLHRHSLGV